MTEVKLVTGAFTGAYAINPVSNKKIPIWISEYVLKDYGTGAIMAVPSDDDRDHAFAEKFGLDMLGVEVKADTLRYSLLLGVFFIVLGAAVAFFAIYQYHVILNSVNVRTLPRGYSTRVVQIINFMVGVFGLLLAAQRPRLILMDLDLPDIKGIDMIQALQKRALTRDIPVVAISTIATQRDIDEAMAAGFKAYLSKPIDVAQITETIQQHMGT